MEEERKSPVPENGEQQLPAENNSIENVEEENQEKVIPCEKSISKMYKLWLD